MLPQLNKDVNVDFKYQQSLIDFFLNKLYSLQITKREILAANCDMSLECFIFQFPRCWADIRQCPTIRSRSTFQMIRLCRRSSQDWTRHGDLPIRVCALFHSRGSLINH